MSSQRSQIFKDADLWLGTKSVEPGDSQKDAASLHWPTTRPASELLITWWAHSCETTRPEVDKLLRGQEFRPLPSFNWHRVNVVVELCWRHPEFQRKQFVSMWMTSMTRQDGMKRGRATLHPTQVRYASIWCGIYFSDFCTVVNHLWTHSRDKLSPNKYVWPRYKIMPRLVRSDRSERKRLNCHHLSVFTSSCYAATSLYTCGDIYSLFVLLQNVNVVFSTRFLLLECVVLWSMPTTPELSNSCKRSCSFFCFRFLNACIRMFAQKNERTRRQRSK